MSVYQDIGLERVINASGRVTVLGVSTISDRVAQAAIAGGQSYVVIDDLMVRPLGDQFSDFHRRADFQRKEIHYGQAAGFFRPGQ